MLSVFTFEDSALLGHYAESSSNLLPMLWDNILVLSSELEDQLFLLGILEP